MNHPRRTTMEWHAMKIRTVASILLAATLALAPVSRAFAQPAMANAPTMTLSLNDAITTALANNLSYRSAQADVNAAAARIVQAAAGRYPTLSVGDAHQHTQSAGAFVLPSPNGPVRIPITATNYNSYNETVQWAINAGGPVEAAVGQASAGYQAAQSDLAATRAQVIDDTTSAYFGLIEARKAATIADLAVSVAQDDVKTSQELYSAGTVPQADVLRQQVSLANAQVAQVQADNAAALANANLANLLNVNLGSTIEPSESLTVAAPSYTLDDLLAEASVKRPEIAAAKSAVEIAQDAVREARAGTLPTFSVQLQNASTTPNFFNVKQPQLSETLAVTWALFDGGLTHGKVAEATADVDKAGVNLQQLKNGVDLEVREAFFNYTAAQAQVAAASSGQASADENLRVTRIRYRAGVGTSLELADALLADTQAQTQYVSAQAGLRTALVVLQRAAGLL
ncbi:MAG TPA: TolC family protein [Candidatus Eremiobacteraceae bacterium]|nr:TolC family protein [Candidatus Eremiobacteraceae bacterium]